MAGRPSHRSHPREAWWSKRHELLSFRWRMSAPTTVEPATLSSRMRRIFANDEDSIAKLQAMQRRRDEIHRKYQAVLDEIGKIEAEAAEAHKEFAKDPTPIGVRKLVAVQHQRGVRAELF